MRRLAAILATTVLAVGLALPAAALDITVNVIAADWTNVVGGFGVDFRNTDGVAGNEEVRWGSAEVSVLESGYRFDHAAVPFTVATGTQFTLGDFTHFNFPIFSGTAITQAQLDITCDLFLDGVASAEGPFTFRFLHDETPNVAGPGLDGNPLANDLVNILNLVTSDTFTVDGHVLTMNLLGFQQGGTFTNFFSTVEGQANTAQLIASFGTAAPIPEPTTMILLGSGLVGLAGYGRKRKK